MIEIKGFDKAYNNMLIEQAVKKIKKDSLKRRINELINAGVEKVMAQCGL